MNNIIKISLLAVTLAGGLSLGAVALAQTSGSATPPPANAHSWAGGQSKAAWRGHSRQAMRRNRMRWLAHMLHLTASQKTAFRQIHAKAMAGIWAARADAQLSPDQRTAQVKTAVEAGRSEFRNLLSPEQRAKLERIESRRERMLIGI
jgi:uncharacterized membrane protein